MVSRVLCRKRGCGCDVHGGSDGYMNDGEEDCITHAYKHFDNTCCCTDECRSMTQPPCAAESSLPSHKSRR